MNALRILGIDPGSRFLGYGLIECRGRTLRPISHGTLSLVRSSDGRSIDQRLLEIHLGLDALIREFSPSALAIEKVFFAKNASSALKLGQARGAAIVTAAVHGLAFHEYSPTEIKSAVVGYGGAGKEQVAQMVRLLLGALEFDTLDASDALAAALCHAQRLRGRSLHPSGNAAAAPANGRRSKSLADAVGHAAKRYMK